MKIKENGKFTWNSHLWDIIKQTAWPFVAAHLRGGRAVGPSGPNGTREDILRALSSNPGALWGSTIAGIKKNSKQTTVRWILKRSEFFRLFFPPFELPFIILFPSTLAFLISSSSRAFLWEVPGPILYSLSHFTE